MIPAQWVRPAHRDALVLIKDYYTAPRKKYNGWVLKSFTPRVGVYARGRQYFIVLKGTDLKSPQDLLDDVRIQGLVGGQVSLVTEANQAVAALLAKGVQKDNILIGGHSLGGYSALATAAEYGLRACAFNAAAPVLSPTTPGPGPEKAVAYHIVGDLLSTHVDPSAAEVIRCDVNYRGKDTLKAHSLDSFSASQPVYGFLTASQEDLLLLSSAATHVLGTAEKPKIFSSPVPGSDRKFEDSYLQTFRMGEKEFGIVGQPNTWDYKIALLNLAEVAFEVGSLIYDPDPETVLRLTHKAIRAIAPESYGLAARLTERAALLSYTGRKGVDILSGKALSELTEAVTDTAKGVKFLYDQSPIPGASSNLRKLYQQTNLTTTAERSLESFEKLYKQTQHLYWKSFGTAPVAKDLGEVLAARDKASKGWGAFTLITTVEHKVIPAEKVIQMVTLESLGISNELISTTSMIEKIKNPIQKAEVLDELALVHAKAFSHDATAALEAKRLEDLALLGRGVYDETRRAVVSTTARHIGVPPSYFERKIGKIIKPLTSSKLFKSSSKYAAGALKPLTSSAAARSVASKFAPVLTTSAKIYKGLAHVAGLVGRVVGILGTVLAVADLAYTGYLAVQAVRTGDWSPLIAYTTGSTKQEWEDWAKEAANPSCPPGYIKIGMKHNNTFDCTASQFLQNKCPLAWEPICIRNPCGPNTVYDVETKSCKPVPYQTVNQPIDLRLPGVPPNNPETTATTTHPTFA